MTRAPPSVTASPSTSTAASSRAGPPLSRRSRRDACACCAPGACRVRRSAGCSRATEVAVVRPLQGLRYDPARAGDLGLVLAPPYDVITPREQAELHPRSPYNVSPPIPPE